MWRLILPFIFSYFWLISLHAQQVPLKEAQRIARSFLPREKRNIGTPLLLQHRSPAAYIFKSGDTFVWVGGDTRLPSIMAYGTCQDSYLPPPFLQMVKGLDHALPHWPTTRTRIGSDSTQFPLPPVAPMLTTIRHQKYPYNVKCPHYKADNGQLSEQPCLVGCVATALEQIFTHYRRTYTLLDTLKGFQRPHVSVPDILPGAQVDTRHILNCYTRKETPEQIAPVATLNLWLGQAVKMNWGLTASGANTERAVAPLEQVFGWKYVHYLNSANYSPQDWYDILLREIYDHRPIYYAGSVFWGEGHAFVLDGVDAQGFFHVNWGYGGNYDGYFNIHALNYGEPPYDIDPEGKYAGFFCAQEALLLHPDYQVNPIGMAALRQPNDLRLIQIQREDTPVPHQFTRYHLKFYNTTSQILQPSLVAITNTPFDIEWLKEGDLSAFTSFTIAPHDTTSVTLYATYSESGKKVLHLTEDGRHFFTIDSTKVADAQPSALTFSLPTLTFTTPTTAHFSTTITNAPDAGRHGKLLLYELIPIDPPPTTFPGVPIEGTRHTHRLFLLPGASTTDTVDFHGLRPGATYQLLVRNRWPIVRKLLFKVPETVGISAPQMPPNHPAIQLDGRRAIHPRHQIIIQNHQKIYIP